MYAGLDHLAFSIDSREVLDDAATQLDRKGVPHGRVKDIGAGSTLEYRDPENIALELFAARSRLIPAGALRPER